MLDWKKNEDIALLVDVLLEDGIVLASSDTVLGLFAQLSVKSKKKLDSIKIRNLKPYIVLVSSQEFLSLYIDQKIDGSMQQIIDRYWPGPLTIIFKAKQALPDWIQSKDATIAIRIPDHAGLQTILQKVDGLFTTSANISDQPLPISYDQVNHKILEQVQATCCDQSKVYDGPASTIVDFSSGVVKIIRQGAIVLDSI